MQLSPVQETHRIPVVGNSSGSYPESPTRKSRKKWLNFSSSAKEECVDYMYSPSTPKQKKKGFKLSNFSSPSKRISRKLAKKKEEEEASLERSGAFASASAGFDAVGGVGAWEQPRRTMTRRDAIMTPINVSQISMPDSIDEDANEDDDVGNDAKQHLPSFDDSVDSLGYEDIAILQDSSSNFARHGQSLPSLQRSMSVPVDSQEPSGCTSSTRSFGAPGRSIPQHTSSGGGLACRDTAVSTRSSRASDRNMAQEPRRREVPSMPSRQRFGFPPAFPSSPRGKTTHPASPKGKNARLAFLMDNNKSLNMVDLFEEEDPPVPAEVDPLPAVPCTKRSTGDIASALSAKEEEMIKMAMEQSMADMGGCPSSPPRSAPQQKEWNAGTCEDDSIELVANGSAPPPLEARRSVEDYQELELIKLAMERSLADVTSPTRTTHAANRDHSRPVVNRNKQSERFSQYTNNKPPAGRAPPRQHYMSANQCRPHAPGPVHCRPSCQSHHDDHVEPKFRSEDEGRKHEYSIRKEHQPRFVDEASGGDCYSSPRNYQPSEEQQHTLDEEEAQREREMLARALELSKRDY